MPVQAVLDDVRNRPGTGGVIPIIDPATEEQVGEFTDCGPEAVNHAVARAKASAESGVWSGLPDYEKAKVLWRVADLIDENAGILAELESSTPAFRRLKRRSSRRSAPNGSGTTPAGARRSTESHVTSIRAV